MSRFIQNLGCQPCDTIKTCLYTSLAVVRSFTSQYKKDEFLKERKKKSRSNQLK